ncbi:UDP-N-acetylmuramate:L-alanyl-gamma-D-glutamyl-meso-diaminopimelate ligase [Aliidiomarina iranensis]|uniref:UDP-N-acetylmuramate--L-alanyl-gamma-D-glutamyl-meso-2,6-diaminoheptandioate ligase n=1 Tax=Aliidiomarina iranensis TaxID=1434071 RepID=A0A432VV61_9GAMM|nr:UDP-N-acetylmuramate:L-alanyl-gamma-D-glutamyl-meso-diaminopimelate ligase [Aliidiomarina iranensis]RUO20362.1 UDP-N-acetylmuramate:L-alanyl-gamma-D-glutamyl-meso-diaminopimelate ligase [Aliidiomarina iranensis]
MKHIHILGICGTFMGGIAALAKALGYRVTGSDSNVYPPMSTQLENLGIDLFQGDDLTQLQATPDLVIIGNALSRGNPVVEAVLAQQLPYQSGPQWLGETLLRERHVLAISGTHGKTTTASMLVWILEQAGLNPSFLVGGVVQPYNETARLTDSPYFVIEADEYDTAFFDKRSKFLHYFSNTLVMNNLEFDHADIFSDLAAIQQQFAYVLRTVPSTGQVIYPAESKALAEVVNKGCWSEQVRIGHQEAWSSELLNADGSRFRVLHHGVEAGTVEWGLIGQHNADNGLMAIAAAAQVGVTPEEAASVLSRFTSPARRLQLRGECAGVRVYDDFAHHPTAIATTLQAMRNHVGPHAKIRAVFEPRSNTMKAGVHKDTLAAAFAAADSVYALQPAGAEVQLAEQLASLQSAEHGEEDKEYHQEHSVTAKYLPVTIKEQVNELADAILSDFQIAKTQTAAQATEEHWVIMSNGAFGGIHQQLLDRLANSSVKHPEG